MQSKECLRSSSSVLSLQITNEPEIGRECHEMLLLLGMQVYHDVQLVVDLTRVVRFQLLYHLARLSSSSSNVANMAESGVNKVRVHVPEPLAVLP